jgi:hypothetical protein
MLRPADGVLADMPTGSMAFPDLPIPRRSLFVPDSSETTFDTSIPVLNDILVPGKPEHARPIHGEGAVAAASTVSEVQPEGTDRAHSTAFAESAAESAAQPADGVTVHSVTEAQVHAFDLPEQPAPFELASAPEPFEFTDLPEPAEPGARFEPGSAFHFARTPEQPAPAQVHPLDADVLAERLRGRFASYLTGEGREVIEARCRDALQDHTTWLVNQITREVALALETEMTGWVREAVDEELGRRSTRH